jgi:predicted ATPase/DNA-binding CsgD family transcriptional regulator
VLIDRDRDMATLLALVDDAACGDGRLVFLGGEAGVGKSSLVTTVCATVAHQVTVRRGTVDNFPTAAALGPLIDAFPDLEDLIGDTGAFDRARLFRRVRAILSEAPTVLLLEDVHWADEATCELLRFLGRRLDGLRVLVIATFRDDEVAPYHPLSMVMGDLGGLSRVSRMTLSRLTSAGVRQLVDATGSALDPDDVYRRTDGNPFFVTEILAAETEAVPRTISDAVLARASRLSPAARQALSAAAVLGRRADVRLIAEVADQPAAAIDECVERGVLIEDGGGLVFRHELARLTVEQALGPGARTELHARALRVLLVRNPTDDRALAYHAGESGDGARVLEYAPRAAEHAARLGAHREAAAHYRRALRVANVPAEMRARLFESLSYECYLTDELTEAISARRRSLELYELAADPEAIGAAERWLSRLSWFMGLTDDSVRYARRAVASLEPLGNGHELAMAYSNLAQLGMLANDVDAALEWGERALELARELGDRDVEIHALNNTGTALAADSDSVEGRHRLTRSLDMALADDAHEHAARAYTNLGSAAVANRRLADADQHLRAGIAYCEEYDLDSWSHYMSVRLAVSLAEQGRYDEAADLCSNVLGHPRLAGISKIPASVVVSQINARRGSADPVMLAEAKELATATRETQRLVPVAAARAEAAWLAGDTDAIGTEIDLAWDSAIAHPDSWELGELSWWLSIADVQRAVPIALAPPFALMIDGAWDEAAAAWDELQCPLWVALCLGSGAELDGARRALEILDGLGATCVRDAVLRRRQALGLRTPRTPRTTTRQNPGRLTAREVEVLQLVAGGLSNLEVAQRLYISERTVEHHMSAALRKLDQPTRARAVAEAFRVGIVTQT